jgi:hypothetical protein
MVAVAVILVWCGPTAIRAWKDDRLDKRSHERKKQAMATAVAKKIKQREAERLNFDD